MKNCPHCLKPIPANANEFEDIFNKIASSAETLAIPENHVTRYNTIIGVMGNAFTARYPERDNKWIEIVKRLGMRWNPDDRRWWRLVGALGQPAVDRVAEAGALFLAAGFPVLFPNMESRRAALERDWGNEPSRWLFAHCGEALALGWSRARDRSWFEEIRDAIPFAVWSKAHDIFIVPPVTGGEFAERFALANGFLITEGAINILDAAREARARAGAKRPNVPEPVTAPVPVGVGAAGGIADEFRDDD